MELYPLCNFYPTTNFLHIFMILFPRPIPKFILNALLNSNWWAAMEDEMHALKQGGLVPVSAGKKATGYQWVYTIKLNLHRTLVRLSA